MQPKRCWICDGPGDSGEHKTKNSDLKSVFPSPTQQKPLFLHDQARKNQRVGSFNSKLLKSSARICQHCNSARTQPHDLAWENLSEFFRITPLASGDAVRFNRVFPHNTRQQTLSVHQFFLKAFGCMLVEASAPLNIISGFADAIMNDKAHSQVFLKFCVPPASDQISAGRSDLETWQSDGHIKFAAWIYDLPHVWVLLMFSDPTEPQREGLVGAWNPGDGSKSITIADFQNLEER